MSFCMPETFAHSGRNCKPFVRHLRGAYSDDVRYSMAMQLRIKELRMKRGWTVEHLAEVVGLSKSYVSEIENGKKPANQARIKKFADALGVKVFELLDQDTLSLPERDLLLAYANMDAEARQSLIAVAKSMSR